MFRDCQVLQLQLSFESISGGRAQLLPNVWQKLGPFAPLVVGAAGAKANGGSYFVAGLWSTSRRSITLRQHFLKVAVSLPRQFNLPPPRPLPLDGLKLFGY